MKVVFAFLAVAMATSISLSQRPNVYSCSNELREGNIIEAKEYIDKAIIHSSTKEWTLCWLRYAQTYRAISDSCIYGSSDKFCEIGEVPLEKSMNGYLKAWVLNFKEKEYRGLNIKNKEDQLAFMKLISTPETRYSDTDYQLEIFRGVAGLKNSFVNAGLKEYQQNNYELALEYFQSALFSSNIQYLIDEIQDLEILYFVSLTHEKLNNYEEARIYYNLLMKSDYIQNDTNHENIVILNARTYLYETDTSQYLSELKNGIGVCKKNDLIYKEIIDHSVLNEKARLAKDLIEEYICIDSTNKVMWFNLGTVYDGENDKINAKKCYSKAIALDENYYSANYNLAALYYNHAIEKMEECGNIPPNEKEKYEECINDINILFTKSYEYFLISLQLSPENEEINKILDFLKNRLNIEEDKP